MGGDEDFMAISTGDHKIIFYLAYPSEKYLNGSKSIREAEEIWCGMFGDARMSQ